MKIKMTPIDGLKVLTPRVFEDDRGYFMETYSRKQWLEVLGTNFVQDNESESTKNVLRGLHFQNPPFAQDKLVRVVKGSVLDVAVDLRKGSPTYGQHYKIILSAENKKQFFIPKGFAHGFLSLEDGTIFSYKCSEYYHPKSEDSLVWNDTDLAIGWGIKNPIITERDTKAQNFSTFETEF